MIKLLAVDMDGTCLDSKGKMSDEVFSALKKAAQAGITVVPTTGRNTNCLPVRIKNEDFYRYVISSNGSLVVDLKENSEIFRAYIDNVTAGKILASLKKHLILTALHLNRDYYVRGIILYCGVRHVLGKDAPRLKIVRNMEKLVSKKDMHVEEFQLFFRGEKYRKIISEIIAPYPEVCAAYSGGYAEIYNKNGSKGTAVLALAEHLGFTADEVACIGDEENDISMFSIAGTSFAMGNAIDKIKEMADVILPTNDENGVAAAINEHILR